MKNRIDINNWKYFSMKELGFENFHGKRLTKKDRIVGDVPLLTAGSEKQGIADYIGNECIIYSNSITVDMFGNVFYHNYDVTGDDNIYFFINNAIGDNEKLFIVSSLRSINQQKYTFNDQFRQDDADKLSVKLPVDSLGNPDWDYMIQYIENIEEKVKLSLKGLKSFKNENKIINIQKWKYFKISDIFNIVSPKVYHTREVKKNPDGIPYVVRSKFNNGIKYYVERDDRFVINPKGVISFGAENASFFYQDKEYISGRDMYYIDTRKLTRNAALFIIACLQKITSKYSYNFGLFPNLLKNEKIKLPIKPNGNPDYEYMDKYMTNLLKESENKLRCLKSI